MKVNINPSDVQVNDSITTKSKKKLSIDDIKIAMPIEQMQINANANQHLNQENKLIENQMI